MAVGTIKAVKCDKGYGFLRPSGDTEDLFFHMSQLQGGLTFDEQLVALDVEFDRVMFQGRERAVAVRPIEIDLPQVRRG